MSDLMTQPPNDHLLPEGPVERPRSASPAELLDRALGFLRRQYWVILSPLLMTMTLGIVYLNIAPSSRFMASATMMIDPQARTGGSQSLQAVFGDAPVDWAWLENQISILRSETIASSVIKELHLTEDPEFVGEGLIHRMSAAISRKFSHSGQPSKPKSDADLMRQAVFVFKHNLDVQRVSGYVIQ